MLDSVPASAARTDQPQTPAGTPGRADQLGTARRFDARELCLG